VTIVCLAGDHDRRLCLLDDHDHDRYHPVCGTGS
jgi:hypothetical protein